MEEKEREEKEAEVEETAKQIQVEGYKLLHSIASPDVTGESERESDVVYPKTKTEGRKQVCGRQLHIKT